jgi:DNA-binding HxlR family transcriptional regulator
VTNRWSSIPEEQCRTFTGAVETVGRRWSGAILLAIARDAHRFSDIRASIPGLSDRMLAQRLRELEADELLTRSVIASTPVQVRYELTERGLALMRALQPLVAWAHEWDVEPAVAV